jgi:phospholipase C
MVPEQDGLSSTLSRRNLFKAGAALGAASMATGAMVEGVGAQGAAALTQNPSSLNDIEHFVILMQENRSFDHYFGTLSGVRGFDDPTVPSSRFYQLDPDLLQNPSGRPYILPWHFDTKTTCAQVANGNDHAWSAQHFMWNEGLMDSFVIAQRIGDDIIPDQVVGVPQITDNGPNTMSYFTRSDIPFYYALADAFTICDNYHCSVLGPTNPNRIMHTTGTLDPTGELGGGPVVDNSSANYSLRWETYAERLQAAGIDWYVYQENDNNGDNMLNLFKNFENPKTEIYERALSYIPTAPGQIAGPALWARLREAVKADQLPQVSWIYASFFNCEHPAAAPADGHNFINGVLQALMSNPKVWAKTCLIINYDENDGKFDHVTPPTPPLGTSGEYISVANDVEDAGSTFGFPGPVGLGFRVPCIICSPFTRGGFVASDVFDHTSVLRLLETRFGVEVPYMSAWRRQTVGDLTTAFNFAAPNYSIPELPNTAELALEALYQAEHLPVPVMPSVQSMPVQEPGPARPQPSGPV